MSFAVIEFAIDEKIDIIPTKWIFEKNSLTRTYWPSLSKSKFTAAFNRASNPESKWDSFEVKKFRGYYETVLAARGKLKRLENNRETSDGTGRRNRKPNIRNDSDANASSPTKLPCSGSLVRVNNSRSLSPKNNQIDLPYVSKSSNFEERPPTHCSKVTARLANHSPSTSGASTRFMDLTSKLPVNFRIALPVKTITEFEDLESRVANDPDLYAELKVISNEVAAGLNWAGHNNKLGFKNFELATIISNCVHGFFKKQGSMSEIERAMKNWLKAAPTRVLNQSTKSRK
ncbi:unnamed protein product [Allacma fusca]|uniref:Uncharacterized protein n=1 Tax=Allacma fusca TaxID=39272 RepID=A0A8J2M9U8_9HEXA|nr:unnamed protein product [Allacma fusca]